jgi:8-oxo-dGTP pyrophosphatase MutT (NUDIX family)
LKDHPGQISFPGGSVEQQDETPAHTAVRETVEEIGVLSSQIELVGVMPPLATGTGFYITPVVGFLDPQSVYAPQVAEVDEVFELPFGFFADPANHKIHPIIYKGKQHRLWAMPYEDRFVWGATAQILRNIYEMICESP